MEPSALYRLVNFLPQSERVTGLLIDQKWDDFKRLDREIKETDLRSEESKDELFAANKAEESWTAWNRGFQVLSSCGSVVLGGIAWMNGVPGPGVALVASGAAGLANQVAQALGMGKFESIVTALTLTTSVAAGWQARALLIPQDFGMVANVVGQASNVFNALTRVGKAKAEARTAEVQRDLSINSTQKRIFEYQQEVNSRQLGELMELDNYLARVAKQAINRQEGS